MSRPLVYIIPHFKLYWSSSHISLMTYLHGIIVFNAYAIENMFIIWDCNGAISFYFMAGLLAQWVANCWVCKVQLDQWGTLQEDPWVSCSCIVDLVAQCAPHHLYFVKLYVFMLPLAHRKGLLLAIQVSRILNYSYCVWCVFMPCVQRLKS